MKMFLKRIFVLVTAVILVFPATVTGQSRNSDARNMWMQGYNKMERAEKALEHENNRVALQLYREAREDFELVRRLYPNWNQSLLAYRVEYCTNHIKELEEKVEAETQDMSRADLQTVATTQAKKIQEDAEQLAVLRAQISSLQDSLERARRESAASVTEEGELQRLRETRGKLLEQLRILGLKVEQLTEENRGLKEAAASQEALKKLEKEHQKSESQLRELNRQVEELTGNQKKNQEQIARLERQESRSAEEKEELNKQLEKADEASRQLLARLEECSKKLRGAESKLEQQQVEQQKLEKQCRELSNEGERLRRELEPLRELRNRVGTSGTESQEFKALTQQLKEKESQLELKVQQLQEQMELTSQEKIKVLAIQEELDTMTGNYRRAARELHQSEKKNQEQQEQYRTQQRLQEQQAAQLGELEKFANQLQEKLKIASEELEVSKKELKAKDELGRQLEQKLRESEEGMKSGQDKLSVLQEELKTLQGQKTELERKVELSEKEGQARTGVAMDLADTQEELKTAQEKLAAAEESLKNLQKQSGEDKAESSEKLQAAGIRIAELEGEVSELKRANQLSAGADEKSRVVIAQLQENNQGLEKQVAELTQQLAELSQNAGDYQKKAGNSLVEFQQEAAKAQRLSSDLAELQKKYSDLELAEADARKKLEAAGAELLKTQLELQRTQDSAQAKLNDLQGKYDKEIERRQALETALIEQPLPEEKGTNNGGGTEKTKETSPVDNQSRVEQAIVRGFLRQGLEAERQQKLEAASWNYNKALEIDPDNGLALKRLGLLAANRGDDEETVKYLQRAYRFNTDDTEILLALGFSMLKLEHPDWALADLSRAAALKPDSANIARLFGVALVRMGWRQAAEVQLKHAYELNKQDPEVSFNLAVLCLTDKPSRREEAAKWYKISKANGAEPDPRLEKVIGK